MENWAKETDNEGCWVKVMNAWLEGQGQDEYPPTWEGLYVLLEDVQLGGHVTALKEAVESARLQGMLCTVYDCMDSMCDQCPDKEVHVSWIGMQYVVSFQGVKIRGCTYSCPGQSRDLTNFKGVSRDPVTLSRDFILHNQWDI